MMNTMLLYTDTTTDHSFGKHRPPPFRYRARTVTLVALLLGAILLRCASDSGSTTQSIVSFEDLFDLASELTQHHAEGRASPGMFADTFSMPVSRIDEGKKPAVHHGHLVGDTTVDKHHLIEFKVLCCVVAAYDTMNDKQNERKYGQAASLFGMLASEVCRVLLAATHIGDGTDTNVVAAHWRLLGNNEVEPQLYALAFPDESGDARAIGDAKSAVEAAFSVPE